MVYVVLRLFAVPMLFRNPATLGLMGLYVFVGVRRRLRYAPGRRDLRGGDNRPIEKKARAALLFVAEHTDAGWGG